MCFRACHPPAAGPRRARGPRETEEWPRAAGPASSGGGGGAERLWDGGGVGGTSGPRGRPGRGPSARAASTSAGREGMKLTWGLQEPG